MIFRLTVLSLRRKGSQSVSTKRRRDPCFSADVVEEFADVWPKCGDDLDGRRALCAIVSGNSQMGLAEETYRAYDRHLLVLPILHPVLPSTIVTHVPRCAMNQPPLELLQPVYVRPPPPAERPDPREQHVNDIVKLFRLALHRGTPDPNVPFAGGFVVPRVYELVLEFDVRTEFVLVDDVVQIGSNLWARGVIGGPVGLNG